MDLRLEELMNLEITSRQQPDRRGFIGGSGGHLIVSADQAGLIRLWKEEHGEVESKGHRARSRVRIAAARRKSATPRSPSSQLGGLLALQAFCFLPQSRLVQPDADPTSGFGDKDQSASTATSRLCSAERLDVLNRLTVSSRFLRAQGRRCSSQDCARATRP